MRNGVVKKYKNSVSSAIFMPYIHQQSLPLSLKPRRLTMWLSAAPSQTRNEMLFNELFIFFFSYIGQRTVIGPSFRILDPFFGVGGSQLLCNYSSWTCKCAQNWNWIWMQRNVPTI